MEVKEKFLKMEPQMPIKSSDKLDEVEDLIYYNEEEDEDQVEESDGNDEIQEDDEVNEPIAKKLQIKNRCKKHRLVCGEYSLDVK